MDPRIQKLARVLVHYSLKLKKGQLLRIDGEVVSLPLMKAVFEEAIEIGAHPYTRVKIPANQELFLKKANEEQMKYISPVLRSEMNKSDAILSIWGQENTRHLSGVNHKRQAKAQSFMKPIYKTLFKRIGDGSLAWCGTQFPSHADAQEAEMSLDDYTDFVFRAGHLHKADPVKDWKKIAKEQDRLIKIMNKIDELHVRGEGTDLKMRIKNRKWINCAGTNNFPDGEIFTGPIESSAEGHITFSYPAVWGGREVRNVRLEFKKGKVVRESADKNLDFLREMLNMDKGARYIGEFAIGTNYEIKQYTRNTLFDEKIGGTCHLAVGKSIDESGGKNNSALHWDMVCDLKKGGEIVADGKTIYRNGKFTI